jgi:hypothetical protein
MSPTKLFIARPTLAFVTLLLVALIGGYAWQLNSDKNADLVAIQDRVQATQSQLPSDLKTPTVSTFDPSQTTVVGMVVSSKSPAPGALAMTVTNRIVPELEQIAGVSSVQAQSAATPAMIVQADPQALTAHGATLNDIVSAISANNNRAPGGYATSGSEGNEHRRPRRHPRSRDGREPATAVLERRRHKLEFDEYLDEFAFGLGRRAAAAARW